MAKKKADSNPITRPVNIPAKYNYEHLMKRHELKHASINFRNNLLQSRSNAAYRNEYDRVNSMLHNHLLSQSSPEYGRLVKRKEDLKRLASQGLYPQHELFKRD